MLGLAANKLCEVDSTSQHITDNVYLTLGTKVINSVEFR